MFWAFAAGAYSQRKAVKAAIAGYEAVKAASNYKPPVVPTIPPKPVIVPSRPVLVPKIETPSVPVPVTVYDTIIRKDFHLRIDSVTGGVVLDTVEYSYVIPSVKWVDPKSLIKEAGAEAGDDTSAVAVDTSSVSYAIPPAISSVNPPKERKTVSLLKNDMPPWGWLLVAVIVILGVYTYICCRSTEEEKEAQRRQEAARKPEEKREDKSRAPHRRRSPADSRRQKPRLPQKTKSPPAHCMSIRRALYAKR